MTKKTLCILFAFLLIFPILTLTATAESENESSSADNESSEITESSSEEVSEESSEDLSQYAVLNILTCGEGYLSLKVGIHKFESNHTETLTLTPNQGYKIHGVEINGKFAQIEGNTVSIDIKVGEVVTVKPVFRGKVTFIVNQTEGGKITPDGTTYVGSGSYFDITATPDFGYICSAIYVNDIKIEMKKDGSVYRSSFKAERDTTYTVFADFTPVETHTITLTKIGNGNVLPFDEEGHSYITSGSDALFQALPGEGYGISSIKIDGATAEWSSDGVFSIKNVTSDISVEIEFIEMASIPVSIKVSGKGTVSNALRAYAGTILSLDVIPDEGHEIVSITVNDVSSVAEAGKLKIAITDEIIALGELKINVVFDAIVDKYPIRTNVVSGIGGTITADGYVFTNLQTEVRKGGSITLKFTPDMGYIIKEVKINKIPVSLSAENTYTISNVSQAYNVSVEFIEDSSATGDFVKINVTLGKGGSVTSVPPISSTSEYMTSLGGSITFTFIPDDGYILDYIVFNEERIIISGNQYTLENLIEDADLEIYFKNVSGDSSTGNIIWGTYETIVDITSNTIVTKEQFEEIMEKAPSKPLVIQSNNYSWSLPANCIYPTEDIDFKTLINQEISEEIRSRIISKLEEKLASKKIQSLEYIIIETKGVSLPVDTYLSVYAGSNFISKNLDFLTFDPATDTFTSIADQLNEGMEEPIYGRTITVGADGRVSFPYNGNQYIVLTVSASSQYRLNVQIEGNGSASPRGESYISINKPVHLQITPGSGYMVGGITVNGTASYDEYYGKTDGFTIPLGNLTNNTDIVITFVPAENVSVSDEVIPEESEGISPLTVTLIIIGIAIIGGIILFIYKWNEEKDIVD